MENFIDNTYFFDLIYLPLGPDVTENLNRLITRYQKDILLKALGRDLYDAFEAGLQESTIEQKWLDLRDGKTYQVDGVNVRWNGLKNNDLESLIAYYVFFNWSRNNVTRQTGNGRVISDKENSTNASSLDSQVYAYNKMFVLYGSFYHSQYAESLYNFIYQMNLLDENTYPNWIFTEIEPINSFGL